MSVVVAFFICWAPFHIQRVYCEYSRDYSEYSLHIYTVVTYVSGVLYYMATAINPVLYNIMSIKFREAFKVSSRWIFSKQIVGGAVVENKFAWEKVETS